MKRSKPTGATQDWACIILLGVPILIVSVVYLLFRPWFDQQRWGDIIAGAATLCLVIVLFIANRSTKTSALEEGARKWDEAARIGNWAAVSPAEFERLLVQRLVALGGSVIHTGRRGDGGVDAVFSVRGKTVVIQAKRYRQPVGPAVVRELIGTMVIQKAAAGVVVGAGGYTQAAREAARGHEILLLRPDQLGELASRYGWRLPRANHAAD